MFPYPPPNILYLGGPEGALILDPVGAREIRNYVKEGLRGQGKTVLFTTHFMNEAEELADRIAILDKGTITAIGSPDELKHEFVKGKIVELRASKVYEDGIERLRDLEIMNLDAFFHSGGAEVTIRILTSEVEDVLNEALRMGEHFVVLCEAGKYSVLIQWLLLSLSPPSLVCLHHPIGLPHIYLFKTFRLVMMRGLDPFSPLVIANIEALAISYIILLSLGLYLFRRSLTKADCGQLK